MQKQGQDQQAVDTQICMSIGSGRQLKYACQQDFPKSQGHDNLSTGPFTCRQFCVLAQNPFLNRSWFLGQI